MTILRNAGRTIGSELSEIVAAEEFDGKSQIRRR